MKLWTRIAFVMLFIPLVAQAQFRDLDAAMSNLERGFGGGDVDAIVSGIGADAQVQLQFPGLADKDGFFGRDQARSEEHTSELQSQSNLVCRLLLEKKKKKKINKQIIQQ